MRNKPRITFEVEETLVLKEGGALRKYYCTRCQETVEMLSPNVLALATGRTEREIFRLVETDAISFEETGRLVVCPLCYKNSIHSEGYIAGNSNRD
jgi:hypothetical protein